MIGDAFRVRMQPLYDAYKHWCEASGEHAMTLMAFGLRLDEHGYAKQESHGIWRLGIGLRQESAS
jgi:hypothetical protein